jgi:hypothetical protein
VPPQTGRIYDRTRSEGNPVSDRSLDIRGGVHIRAATPLAARDAGHVLVDPAFDQIRDLLVVALHHHHVAVAGNARLRERHRRRVAALTLQLVGERRAERTGQVDEQRRTDGRTNGVPLSWEREAATLGRRDA